MTRQPRRLRRPHSIRVIRGQLRAQQPIRIIRVIRGQLKARQLSING